MINTQEISVIIADAQSVFRVGLRNLLSENKNINVLGEAGNGDELKSLLYQHSPDILILDFNPSYFDSDDLSKILHRLPQCRVMIISSQEKKWQIFKSLELNVFSYLTKECGQDEIIKAIHTIASGEKFFCNYIVDILLENKLIQNKNNHQEKPPIVDLTERELEITKLIAKGKKNREIADELNLSHHTIHSHRKNILKKVGVSSALELTTYAIKTGIIDSDIS